LLTVSQVDAIILYSIRAFSSERICPGVENDIPAIIRYSRARIIAGFAVRLLTVLCD
jgi:hypothetical protein